MIVEGVVHRGVNESSVLGKICGASVARMGSVVIHVTAPLRGFVVCVQGADENCCSPNFGPLHYFRGALRAGNVNNMKLRIVQNVEQVESTIFQSSDKPRNQDARKLFFIIKFEVADIKTTITGAEMEVVMSLDRFSILVMWIWAKAVIKS